MPWEWPILGDKPKDTQIVFAAHACVLAPGALNDTAAVVALAQQRLTLKHLQPGDLPFARHVLSLARYRAGQFAEVRDELAASDRGAGDDAPALLDGFLRAMNYQQLGLRTEALQTYEATTQRISRLGAGRPSGAWQFHPRGWTWRDWLAVVILKAEAESLLGASPLKSNCHKSSDAIRSQITRDARSQPAAMP